MNNSFLNLNENRSLKLNQNAVVDNEHKHFFLLNTNMSISWIVQYKWPTIAEGENV